MYVTANVINSKRKKIKVKEFREFCKEAMLHIKTYFKTNIANDVHVILGHVCDMIEANGGYGLGDFSEVSNFCIFWQYWSWNMSWYVTWNLCKIREIPWIWTTSSLIWLHLQWLKPKQFSSKLFAQFWILKNIYLSFVKMA